MQTLQNNVGYLVNISLLFSMMIGLRACLIIAHQTWVSTFAHSGTLLILPIITYIVTNVISGNIALSLGMVGALSIVRFRNPVKSPLELSVYFAAITAGIAATVDVKWSLLLVGFFCILLISMRVVSYLSQTYFKTDLFHASFTEGNVTSVLELDTSQRISEIEAESCLISASKLSTGMSYILVSDDFKRLQHLYDKYADETAVQRIVIRR